MDVSTRKVLKRTLSVTSVHVESDQSGTIEEKWGDVSIAYKGYTKYDEEDVITNITISEDERLGMRQVKLDPSINEKIAYMNDYYIEHKLGPYEFAFDDSKKDQLNNLEDNNQLSNIQENNEGPNSFGAISGIIQDGEEF